MYDKTFMYNKTLSKM